MKPTYRFPRASVRWLKSDAAGVILIEAKDLGMTPEGVIPSKTKDLRWKRPRDVILSVAKDLRLS